MKAFVIQTITSATIGITLTLLAISTYWQSQKEHLAQKVLSTTVTQDNICVDDTIEMTAPPVSEEDEIYFVGCGGFF